MRRPWGAASTGLGNRSACPFNRNDELPALIENFPTGMPPVEFHPDHIPGLLKLAGLEIELSKILGKKVDLRTAQDLSIYFRDDVLKHAKVAYVEA